MPENFVSHKFEPLENSQTKKPSKLLLSNEVVIIAPSSYLQIIKVSFSMLFRFGGLIGVFLDKFFPLPFREICKKDIDINNITNAEIIQVRDIESIKLSKEKLSYRLIISPNNNSSVKKFKVIDASRVEAYKTILKEKYEKIFEG